MSDARLRELERRWRDGRDPEDAARWVKELERAGRPAEVLHARVEAGLLARARLAAAAGLGDETARAALALAGAPMHESRLPELEAWLEALRPVGPEAWVRAAVAAARAVLPALESALPGERRPAIALDAASAWLACPCQRHADAARSAAEEAWRLCDSEGRRTEPELQLAWERAFPAPAASNAAAAVASAAGAAAFACFAEEAMVVAWAVHAANAAAETLGSPLSTPFAATSGGRAAELAFAAARAAGASPIREAIRAELVPWLLGPG